MNPGRSPGLGEMVNIHLQGYDQTHGFDFPDEMPHALHLDPEEPPFLPYPPPRAGGVRGGGMPRRATIPSVRHPHRTIPPGHAFTASGWDKPLPPNRQGVFGELRITDLSENLGPDIGSG